MDERPPSLWVGMWKRFLIGGVLIVLLSAGATATVALNTASGLAHDIFPAVSHIEAPRGLVTPEYSGGAQTFLILGSDRREGSKDSYDKEDPPHSDTILLVRFDPEQGQTSVLSIPRDLMVNITTPSGQVYAGEKINAAYTIGSRLEGAKGGIVLAAETIKREVFPELTLNGIIDVNFKGFIQVVDTLGCAYVNVDHHYYNENVGTTETDYTSINLQPGYQKLCYENALDYVRYRHTDSDFVRVARQQDFLRDLREQINPADEIGQIDTVAKAVGHAITSTFHASAEELIELAKLIAFSQSKPLRQVKFQTTNVDAQINGGSYVTSNPTLEQATLADFLHGHEHLSLPASPNGHSSSSHHHHSSGGVSPRAIGLFPSTSAGESETVKAALEVPFPVLYPTLADGPRRTAAGARVHAQRPAGQSPPRLRDRLAAELDRRLLQLRGHRLAEPTAVRPRSRPGHRRPLLRARRRRRTYPRRRLALGPRPLLGDEHATGGTLERADARNRQIRPATALAGR